MYFFLVVNASRKLDDFLYLQDKIGDRCNIELLDNRSLIALQGPSASSILEATNKKISEIFFLDVRTIELFGINCWVSRSGYTGEDGFELSVPNEDVTQIVEEILSFESVLPIGLGARDSLRLEAGLCLYGQDLDKKITPVEASLSWTIHKTRRMGGKNEAGFIGHQVILNQLQSGTTMKRVALLPKERAPIREGCKLFATSKSDMSIGAVTSGGFSPTLQKPISQAYIKCSFAEINNEIFAEVRGRRTPVKVSSLPFVETKYKLRKKGVINEIY